MQSMQFIMQSVLNGLFFYAIKDIIYLYSKTDQRKEGNAMTYSQKKGALPHEDKTNGK